MWKMLWLELNVSIFIYNPFYLILNTSILLQINKISILIYLTSRLLFSFKWKTIQTLKVISKSENKPGGGFSLIKMMKVYSLWNWDDEIVVQFYLRLRLSLVFLCSGLLSGQGEIVWNSHNLQINLCKNLCQSTVGLD